MKKILLSLAVFALALTANAQEQVTDSTTTQMDAPAEISVQFDNDCCFSVVVPVKASASQIYKYARAFFTANSKDYQSAVLIEDTESSKLQLNYRVGVGDFYGKPLTGKTLIWKWVMETGKLTVDGKDNRFRIKLEEPKCSYTLFMSNGMKVYERKGDITAFCVSSVQDGNAFNASRAASYKKLIEKLKAYIEKEVADEDF